MIMQSKINITIDRIRSQILKINSDMKCKYSGSDPKTISVLSLKALFFGLIFKSLVIKDVSFRKHLTLLVEKELSTQKFMQEVTHSVMVLIGHLNVAGRVKQSVY